MRAFGDGSTFQTSSKACGSAMRSKKSYSPYESQFIQDRFLTTGALDGLNEDARFVIYVAVETGLRLSEVVNLQESTIHLDAAIPYVRGSNRMGGVSKNDRFGA